MSTGKLKQNFTCKVIKIGLKWLWVMGVKIVYNMIYLNINLY